MVCFPLILSLSGRIGLFRAKIIIFLYFFVTLSRYD